MHGKPVMAAECIKVDDFFLDILCLIAQLFVAVFFENALELCDDHILLCLGELINKSDQTVAVKPVISVQKAEIFTCRGLDGGIDSRTVSAVLFVDHAEGLGISGLIFAGDLQCAVCGAVVDDEDLQPVHDLGHTAGIQRLADKFFNIIGCDRYAQYFFHSLSPDLREVFALMEV